MEALGIFAAKRQKSIAFATFFDPFGQGAGTPTISHIDDCSHHILLFGVAIDAGYKRPIDLDPPNTEALDVGD